ncbi:MAG: HlyC/CorC family transporter [Candidatus Cloacimonetes bacterium]|nr:HlyC/CorC family transporter [Candidatus Cloacimonadota bacterium]
MSPAELIVIGTALLMLLAFSFVFSGFETGMISINQINLEHKARRNRSAARLLAFIRQPDRFLGTTLIGNNIVNVLLASLSTYLVHRIHTPWLPAKYSAILIAVIVLSFGEIIPKAIFRDHAETIVPRFFPVLLFFYYLLKPLVYLVSLLNSGLRRFLKLDARGDFNYLTRDDLTFLLSQTQSDPSEQPQMEMIEDALEFREQVARNVMVPRMDIVAIPGSATIEEAIAIAREEGFTRYPVYGQNLDDIIGVLIIYDILKRDCTKEMTAEQIVHEPLFAPENTDLDVLLKEMQQKHRTMAIIVDSYGGTAGIVTMEDILEEIVGDIEDEYDAEEEEDKDVEQISANTWLAQADVEIDHLADEHGIELPEGDYETIAGLILDKLERIPHQGQFISVPPYRLQVLQATDKKIIKVKIHKINN